MQLATYKKRPHQAVFNFKLKQFACKVENCYAKQRQKDNYGNYNLYQ